MDDRTIYPHGAESCADAESNCKIVDAGTSDSWVFDFDGGCPGLDTYEVYVHVFGSASPAYSCVPYTLEYQFAAGCFP